MVYASDHGGTCGEHRNFDHGAMYEGSIRVPLVVAGPGVRAGQTEPTVVSMMDLFPTLCDAVGLEHPYWGRGTSLMGLVKGEAGARGPDFALCEYHGAGFPASVFAVRSGRHKYVECVGERPMFFDLAQDPNEMSDLATRYSDDPDVRAPMDQLRDRLYAICSPEAVDARAKAAQRARKREMTESGRIYEELWQRGYERRADRLVMRDRGLENGG